MRLYSENHVKTLRKRVRAGRTAGIAALGISLAVCILLCASVRTANTYRRLTEVILISALGAWTAVLLYDLLILPSRREAEHEAGVLGWEAGSAEGVLSAPGKVFQIPKSIAFAPVTLETPEGPLPLKINARFLSSLPPAGTRVRVETGRTYITGWEVTGDEA